MFFSLSELSIHPSKTLIYQRVTKADEKIAEAQRTTSIPKEHEIHTTGLGIDWTDVEREAKLALGKKLLPSEPNT